MNQPISYGLTEIVIKIVDASALGSLIFNEPDAGWVAQRLGGSRLVAPALLKFEMASICLKKLKRYPERRELINQSFRLWPAMEIKEVDINSDEMVALAEQTSLTVYDAAYLWLAQTLGAELVTLDTQLANAAADT